MNARDMTPIRMPRLRMRSVSSAIVPIVAVTVVLTLTSLLAPGRGAAAEPPFLRGDANVDGEMSLSDSLAIRRYLFNGDRPPSCFDAADTNDDGRVDISDQVFIMNRLFLGGGAVPLPHPSAGPDPTPDDGLPCAAYDVTPPEETDDVIHIGDVSARPGEEVVIPVHLTSAHETEAFQLVVSYDPSVFTPRTDMLRAFSDDEHPAWPLVIEGSVNEELYTQLYSEGSPVGPCESAFYVVAAYPEEGVFTLGFIPSFICTGYEVPPVDDAVAFNILGTVSEAAPPGSVVSLEPMNGPDGQGFGSEKLHNELTYRGGARFVTIFPKTIPGELRVVPDIAIFIRGDTNSDAVLDIGDPVATLGFLFLGDPEPPCLDAADATDDGVLDITDPVATLMYLFVGGPPLPAPWGTPGEDPTADTLDCVRGS